MTHKIYNQYDEWHQHVLSKQLDIESWGQSGSKSCVDIEGRIVGEWLSRYDTNDDKEYGWISCNID